MQNCIISKKFTIQHDRKKFHERIIHLKHKTYNTIRLHTMRIKVSQWLELENFRNLARFRETGDNAGTWNRFINVIDEACLNVVRDTWNNRSRNHNSPSPVHARNFRYFHIRSIFSLYVAWDSIVESLSESTLARLRVRALYFHGRHSRNVFTYSHRGLSFKLFTTMGCEGIRVSGKGSLLYELHSFREKRKEKWEWLEERKKKKKEKEKGKRNGMRNIRVALFRIESDKKSRD